MSIDLDAYFARIGYTGPRDATLTTLNAIVLAHAQAIPFENIDVVLDRGVDLSLDAIVKKLVDSRRGGYCFEQNTLLMHVLHALGFAATPISARVRIHRPRDFTPPRTHMFLRVDLDGEPWLVDVGVGALSPTAALRLVLDVEQATPHEPRRIVAEGDWHGLAARGPDARLFHQVRFGDTWHDVCEFTLEPMPEIDRETAHWFTSTHPRSHFRDRLMVARATAGGRVTLLNTELMVRDAAGQRTVTPITSQAELHALVAEHFAIQLAPDVIVPCPGLPA